MARKSHETSIILYSLKPFAEVVLESGQLRWSRSEKVSRHSPVVVVVVLAEEDLENEKWNLRLIWLISSVEDSANPRFCTDNCHEPLKNRLPVGSARQFAPKKKNHSYTSLAQPFSPVGGDPHSSNPPSPGGEKKKLAPRGNTKQKKTVLFQAFQFN